MKTRLFYLQRKKYNESLSNGKVRQEQKAGNIPAFVTKEWKYYLRRIIFFICIDSTPDPVTVFNS
jgi:hypothetical protein